MGVYTQRRGRQGHLSANKPTRRAEYVTPIRSRVIDCQIRPRRARRRSEDAPLFRGRSREIPSTFYFGGGQLPGRSRRERSNKGRGQIEGKRNYRNSGNGVHVGGNN